MLLSAFLYALGLLFVGLTCTMTWLWGYSMGLHATHQMVLAFGSIGIDLLVVALAAMTGWAFRHKRRGIACLTLVATLIFASFSMIGVVGFVAGERIAKARLAEDTHVANKTLVAETNKVAIAMANQRAEWLRDTYVETRDKSEKKSLLAESKTAVPALQAPAVATMADPQAQILAEISGLTIAKVQVVLAIAISILLPFGKMLCFSLAPIAWPRRIEEPATVGLTPVMDAMARDVTGGGDTVSAPPVAAITLSEPHTLPVPDPKVVHLPVPSTAIAEDAGININEDGAITGIAKFWATQTLAGPGHGNVRAHQAYRDYLAWAKHAQMAEMCTSSVFHQISKRLGIAKNTHSNGTSTYTNRQIIPHTGGRVTASVSELRSQSVAA